MIPIWLAVTIAFITSWIGFFTCALLTIGRDVPSQGDEVDDIVYRRDMEGENVR